VEQETVKQDPTVTPEKSGGGWWKLVLAVAIIAAGIWFFRPAGDMEQQTQKDGGAESLSDLKQSVEVRLDPKPAEVPKKITNSLGMEFVYIRIRQFNPIFTDR
jgi:hypothetical protein